MIDVAALRVKFGITGDDTVNRALDRTQKNIRETGGAFGGIAKGIGSGLALEAVRRFAFGSVSAASDITEATNKAAKVFKTEADNVLKWAENSAGAVALSESAALSQAATFGNLFAAMGIGTEKVDDMSMAYVQLAADMASFHNISAEEANRVLQSALVGETEAIRRYGVVLDEARVKQKAQEMGLVSASGELTAQQKVLARNAIIMEDTKVLQGDLADTSKDYANATRILGANLGNLRAVIGQRLIPAFTSAVNIAIKGVGAFLALPGPIQSVAIAFGFVVAAGIPLLSMLSMMLPAISLITAPLLIAGAAFAALGAAIAFDIGGVRGTLSRFIDDVGKLGKYVKAAFGSKVRISDMMVGIKDQMPHLAKYAESILRISDGIGDLVRTARTQGVGEALSDLFGETGAQIAGAAWTFTKDVVIDGAVMLAGPLKELADKGWQAFANWATDYSAGDGTGGPEFDNATQRYPIGQILIEGTVKLAGELEDLATTIANKIRLQRTEGEIIEARRAGEEFGADFIESFNAGVEDSTSKEKQDHSVWSDIWANILDLVPGMDGKGLSGRDTLVDQYMAYAEGLGAELGNRFQDAITKGMSRSKDYAPVDGDAHDLVSVPTGPSPLDKWLNETGDKILNGFGEFVQNFADKFSNTETIAAAINTFGNDVTAALDATATVIMDWLLSKVPEPLKLLAAGDFLGAVRLAVGMGESARAAMSSNMQAYNEQTAAYGSQAGVAPDMTKRHPVAPRSILPPFRDHTIPSERGFGAAFVGSSTATTDKEAVHTLPNVGGPVKQSAAATFGYAAQELIRSQREIEKGTKAISDDVTGAWDDIGTETKPAWTDVTRTVSTQMTATKLAAVGSAGAVQSDVTGAWQDTGAATESTFEGIARSVGSKMGEAKTGAVGAAAEMAGGLGATFATMTSGARIAMGVLTITVISSLIGLSAQTYSLGYASGNNAAAGFSAGIWAGMPGVYAAVAALAAAAITAMTTKLLIQSPSKVFAEKGRYAALGFAQGAEGMIPSVTAAFGRMGDAAVAGAAPRFARGSQQATNGGPIFYIIGSNVGRDADRWIEEQSRGAARRETSSQLDRRGVREQRW